MKHVLLIISFAMAFIIIESFTLALRGLTLCGCFKRRTERT